MGVNSFCTCIYSNPSLKEGSLQGAYNLLDFDRQGTIGKHEEALLCRSIKMFHAFGVYTKDFEPKFIGDSESYLLSWADYRSSSLALEDYVRECHELIEKETNRCSNYGLDSTTSNLLKVHIEVGAILYVRLVGAISSVPEANSCRT